jgi:methionyl-tRNA synthetase
LIDQELINLAVSTPAMVHEAMLRNDFNTALAAIWKLIDRSNKYIDETLPWSLAKDMDKKVRLGTVLYNLSESLRFVAVLLQPFMPETSPKMLRQLGLMGRTPLQTWESLKVFGKTPAGTRVKKEESLFPRIETEQTEAQKAKKESRKKEMIQPEKGVKDMNEETVVVETTIVETNILPDQKPQITIDDFAKIDFRIAEIVACEKVPKADRLLKLRVRIGQTERIIVSGIAEYYSPEDLVGRQVCVVANLAPHTFRGIESNGMLLAASDDAHTSVILLQPEKKAQSGWRVK